MAPPASSNVEFLVTGAGGQLGSEMRRLLGDRSVGCDRRELDITDRTAVRTALQRIRPATLINAAAFTAVDKAEEEREICRQVNATAVRILAEETADVGCRLVQVSTDYVYGGESSSRRPFVESDPPAPQGVYATTKLEGEFHAAINPKHFIVRTCGIYGSGSKGNFVTTMLRLGRERDSLSVVNDQHCTPTWVEELAAAVEFLATTNAFGTYHIVNGGSTTWFGMAEEIFRLAKVECHVEPITTAQYGAPAPRPGYSVLNSDKYRSLGGPPLSTWRVALEKFLHKLLNGR